MIPPPPGARIHLIGIGGTAMSALAGLLQEAGYRVTGSDQEVYPPVSTLLAELGIAILEGFSASHLQPPPDLVVVGNAISRGNEEVEAVLDAKLPYASLPETLRELFLRDRETIVVAGTHGKTSVTALLAWLFQAAGRDPGFLIGGVPCNFPRSFRIGNGADFIVEGDEYDTAFFDKGPKFLHYRPDSVVLTSVEFDHADIYPDLTAVQTAFRRLVNLVPRRGLIVARAGSETVGQCIERCFCRLETFGLNEGDWQAHDIACRGEATEFTVLHRQRPLGRLVWKLFGEHNVLNALAAVALATHYGIAWADIRAAMESFEGVRRRMEVVGEAAGVTVVDDFAHHPTAIRETLRAARQRFAGRRLWALLEPRSNTLRRKVFEEELVEALSLADRVIVAEVYQSQKIAEHERLEPAHVIQGLQARGLVAEIGGNPQQILESLPARLQHGDVVIAMSNGAFGGIHRKLLQALAATPCPVSKPSPLSA
ncbi:MAG: UDP-N-acetylmuramate:L-alanyl-gamma-D-glutamyl-meso-diaminopimelate ligase [Acidobacteria bacterium RIFCSPLOWO2_02_FULL_59_13]|nr:MAG: UDP-N-acetylmuramate:L-alanyl-gamma-D-glutamyl-meso-diaminopimelate ligase [Acidobacteria bacterium RIFCSPLOWO2_02_FULL_59_13]